MTISITDSKQVIFVIKFDGKFCDLACDSLSIPTNPDEYFGEGGWGHECWCDVFRCRPKTMLIDGELKLRRKDDCMKKYGMGERMTEKITCPYCGGEHDEAWVSCSKRLPEKGVDVLILLSSGYMYTGQYDGCNWCILEYDGSHHVTSCTTHWHTLPKLPKMEKE